MNLFNHVDFLRYHINFRLRERRRKCNLPIIKTTKSSARSLRVKIFDVATGTLLDLGEVNGEYEWDYIWMSSFQGDKRAIPNEMPITELRFPTQNEMMQPANEFVAQALYEKISNYVRETFE